MTTYTSTIHPTYIKFLEELSNVKPKTEPTDRDRFDDLVRTSGWAWGDALVDQTLQEKAVEGLEALAALWFRHYEDEQNLPYDLVRLYKEVTIDLLLFSELIDKCINGDDEDEDEDED